jgi:ABC-type multidrug transport system fused ATPase/permease subunit
MLARDERTHMLTEALHGIRQIKFSALENQWQETIMKLRDHELSRLKRVFIFATLLVFLWLFLPILLGTVALGMYAWLNGEMTASVVFTALSVFQSLEWTLGVIPNTITEFFDAKISIARIQEYLDMADKEISIVPGDSIVFEEATIAWPSGTDEPDSSAFSLTEINLAFPNQELRYF